MRSIYSLVVMSILLVLVTRFSSVKSDAAFIANACKNTPNVALCTSTLDYNPSHRSTDDVGSLVNILVDVIVLRSNFVLSIIKGKPSGSADACNRDYSLILSDHVERVRQSLPGDPKLALDGVNAISVAATSCQHLNPPSTPIFELSKQVINLSAIAAALIQTLH